jgi:hypothetical protein
MARRPTLLIDSGDDVPGRSISAASLLLTPSRRLPRLSAQEIIVDRLYVEFGVGADTFLYDTELTKRFASSVAAAIGRAIRPDVLAAALVERRKNDDLPRLRPQGGFEDIDEVA